MTYQFGYIKKTDIHMEDCPTLGCDSTLRRELKEHKKRKGKDHVCNPACNRWLTSIHHEKHAWYNEQKRGKE